MNIDLNFLGYGTRLELLNPQNKKKYVIERDFDNNGEVTLYTAGKDDYEPCSRTRVHSLKILNNFLNKGEGSGWILTGIK